MVAEESSCWFQLRAQRTPGYHPPRILVTHEDVTAVRRLGSASIDEVEAAILAVDQDGAIRVANQVIQMVATRLQQTVRVGDTVARLEGGRFVVVVPNLHEVGDACFAVQRLRQNFARLVMAGKEVLDVTAGVGAAMFPWESGAADALDAADDALRTARAARTESRRSAVGGSEVFRDLFLALSGGDPSAL